MGRGEPQALDRRTRPSVHSDMERDELEPNGMEQEYPDFTKNSGVGSPGAPHTPWADRGTEGGPVPIGNRLAPHAPATDGPSFADGWGRPEFPPLGQEAYFVPAGAARSLGKPDAANRILRGRRKVRAGGSETQHGHGDKGVPAGQSELMVRVGTPHESASRYGQPCRGFRRVRGGWP